MKAIKKKGRRRKLPTLKGRSKIKEGECLLSLGKTRSFTTNVESRYQKKKSGLQTWLLASMIKLLMLSDDWDWLFIKEKVGFALWHMSFSLQRQQEKEKWWIIDVDTRFLKPANTFWACKIPFFHSHKPLAYIMYF